MPVAALEAPRNPPVGHQPWGCQPYSHWLFVTPEWGVMKKRLLITGLVLAALLLALYGVMFGTGAD